ncbi:hypothetical protein GVN20_18900 [Runella sp. CRIBMP]|uniref:hypothetical protein n=1 Tax=Runella sp. CRIBMP TaxID=2683261 RepID=UPI0014123E8D|nr:hypothetical protein [Runella sp. CRIBMP]NBB21442.1 hypothetical protein [Runella sp. CRIBMP]
MDTFELLGVHRNKKFSPNHIGNDDAIFSLTAQALQRMGCTVSICCEDEFLQKQTIEQRFIFTMARQKEVVKKLQELELAGKVVVNSGFGIEKCFRTNMTKGLVENGIPYPKSFIVPTSYTGNDVFEQLPGKGFWIKRGDFHAIHKEDVTFAASADEAREILREYALRDIPDAVISEHLMGDLVKFYAVRNTDFFYWFYPYANNHHKYADYENINGKSLYYPFDEDALRKAANASAEALDVHVYGGDAIVGKDGRFHIIDLNDWPSFAPCRQDAAESIAQAIFQQFTIAA